MIFTLKHDSKEITADDLILGIYLYTKKLPIHTLFWKFVWFRNPENIQSYIDDNYDVKEWVTKIAETFQLSAGFDQHFTFFVMSELRN